MLQPSKPKQLCCFVSVYLTSELQAFQGPHPACYAGPGIQTSILTTAKQALLTFESSFPPPIKWCFWCQVMLFLCCNRGYSPMQDQYSTATPQRPSGICDGVKKAASRRTLSNAWLRPGDRPLKQPSGKGRIGATCAEQWNFPGLNYLGIIMLLIFLPAHLVLTIVVKDASLLVHA